MKIKFLLLTLMSFLTLNVFSQFPINLTVIGDTNCPYTVTGMYIDSLNQTTGELVLTLDPFGNYTTSVPVVGNNIYVSLCATNCVGMTECTSGIVIFGAINTYVIDLVSGIDNDNDGWNDEYDCDPFDPNTYPGAWEMCDGIDNNCDGQLETTPSLNMSFVSDSLVFEDNTIFLINQSSNCIGYTWNFGNGDTSNTSYPTTTYGSVGTYQICVGVFSVDGCFDDTCFVITIDSTGWFPGGIMTEWTLNVVDSYTVGVEETTTNNVKVYPNPITDFVNITTNSNNMSVKIYSIDGKMIENQVVNSNNLRISTDNFNSGIYFVQVESNNQKSVFKLTK
jgi:hypothetical protein